MPGSEFLLTWKHGLYLERRNFDFIVEQCLIRYRKTMTLKFKITTKQ